MCVRGGLYGQWRAENDFVRLGQIQTYLVGGYDQPVCGQATRDMNALPLVLPNEAWQSEKEGTRSVPQGLPEGMPERMPEGIGEK